MIDGFLVGVKEKYPEPLLKRRIEIEGNVISCLFTDMLLIDDIALSIDDFITEDGAFYYRMLTSLKEKNFNSLDEVTILSNFSDEFIEKFNDKGGFETIQHQIDIINAANFDTYLDNLYRENILLKMHDDGIDLMHKTKDKGKDVPLLKIFRSMTSDEVIDWWDTRITGYGIGYNNKKVLEEEDIIFDDKFIEQCAKGEENGVPIDKAGTDINGEEIHCFSFLSKQINGLLEGTFTMLGGFSSTGKSTWFVTVIMCLLYRGKKVLIISNEENAQKFKVKFFVWLLGKYRRYFYLTKKKLTNGEISPEDKKELKEVMKYWRANYEKRLKFISIADADMGLVKKKIRENVLRSGFDTVLYDTFKIQMDSMSDRRSDLDLIRDSRELHQLAKKYNLIMLASIQLAEYMKGQLFLTASSLSNSKQIKEILENLFLMRNVYKEELDPNSHFYCHPFQTKKINDKWVDEPYEPDPNAVWRMLFVEKCRSGINSSDNGKAYLLKYDGDFCIFREQAQCKPCHGEIK